jgi:2-hydroxycyclohexanecarboxyl-CoA dehydrogenase
MARRFGWVDRQRCDMRHVHTLSDQALTVKIYSVRVNMNSLSKCAQARFMGRLSDKIAIVTGAGQGIGKAIATKLGDEGAIVVVTDLDEASAKEVAEALPSAVAIRTDVTDRDAVAAMVDRVVQQFGRVDVLVNNAGWDKGAAFLDSDPADWDRAIRINLYGVLHTCKAVLPVMAAASAGAVVNLGSDAGRVGSSGEAVYSAAKGGVIAFTKSLAREMARSQVRVNCVCPGPTDTALFASFAGPKLREALTKAIPFRRLGQPEDIANAVAFLASDEASFITGQTLSVSGGLTMS